MNDKQIYSVRRAAKAYFPHTLKYGNPCLGFAWYLTLFKVVHHTFYKDPIQSNVSMDAFVHQWAIKPK